MLDQTQVDSLTGCFVRGALSPFLERLIIESKAKAKNFTMALIDLDRFKKFNDKYGHLFGDEILRYVTSTLRMTFSEQQCSFFRYGGDEFIGAFFDTAPKEILRLLLQCNYNLVHRPFLFKNKFYRITLSCGIASFPYDGNTMEELIKKADDAMYLSKRYGRNRVTLASRIKYLKLLRMFIVIVSIATVCGSLFITYIRIIQPAVSRFQDGEFVVKPNKLDTVILKSGLVLEGRILEETADKVILNLFLGKGEGSVTFNKSEISQIRYGLAMPPQKEQEAPAK